MTGEKLFRLLTKMYLEWGLPLRGVYIAQSPGNELALEISSQLRYSEHSYMLRVGFIFNNDQYIYRPPSRKR
jgi:hypothetical protein